MNWYSYTHNPIVYSDPSGLYWACVHGNDTWEAAAITGLPKDAVNAISEAAVRADDPPAWSPEKARPPHTGSLEEYAQNQLMSAFNLYNAGNQAEAWKALGYGAHAIQDYYAHNVGTATTYPVVVLAHLFTDPDDPRNNQVAYDESKQKLQEYFKSFQQRIAPQQGGGGNNNGTNNGNCGDSCSCK